MSDGCLDDAASFLQTHSRRVLHESSENDEAAFRGSGVKADAEGILCANQSHGSLRAQKVSAIAPFDCQRWNKPIQVLKTSNEYSVQELNISSGAYSRIFSIPSQRSGWKFQRLNACGISPVDSIIYCAMLVKNDQRYYLVRIDQEAVEFVAKLPFDRATNANSAGFSQSGTLFLADHAGRLMVVKDVDRLKGVPGTERSSVELDLSTQPLVRPKGFFRADDVVVASADLLGNGPEEFLFVVGQAELQVAKYDYKLETFTRGWKISVEPYRWDRFYGAGWNYNNQVLFAENKGHGVYQVPFDYLKLIMMAGSSGGHVPRVKLQLNRIGASDPAMSNDGMNCMYVPNPFIKTQKSFIKNVESLNRWN